MKKITFAILLMGNFIFAQSNHTVSFSGSSSDFNVAEKIWGGDDVDYYVTFDDTYMYFGAFRVNGSTFGGYDHFTIYLDSDPQSTLTSGNGNTTGMAWDSNTPTLPFNADHRFAIRNNTAGESFHHKYTGGSWQDQTSGNVSSFNQYTTAYALEIRIPKTSIDSANGIYFTMYMSYNGGFFGANDGSYPISISGSTVSGYFGGIGINAAGCTPINSSNTPITGTLTNTNPTANGKYAHIDINSGDFSVTGDIEIVSGGTSTITAGNSLTVDGTLTNNGAITLESTPTSYSSLIATIVAGSGTVNYNRSVNSYTNDATNNDNDLISAPVTGQPFGSFADANTNLLASGIERAFAPFNNTTGSGAYENYDTTDNASTLITPATGYRAATTDGGTLTFTGTVQTGDVSIDISTPGGGSIWNLIGNPYPSYIDAEAFLTHVVSTETSGERNIDLLDNTSGIYGYDGDASDGWDIITLANANGHYLAPGQGFFVAASGDGTLIADHDIEFTAAMRTTGTSDDFIAGRNNNPLTFIELKAFTANNDYSTEFYFDADASQGLDPGYDAVIWGGSAPSFALYSHLVQDNTGLPIALQALSDTDYNNVIIPLGVNANMSEQLTFNIVENTLPASIEVYLDDTLTSTSTLLNTSDYVLTPTEDLNGTGRFYLRFSNSALSITDSDYDGVSIYANQNNKTITIAGQLTEGTSATIYDIQGRLIASKALASNTTLQTIDVSHVNTGIYIVKLANGNTVKTEKVILK